MRVHFALEVLPRLPRQLMPCESGADGLVSWDEDGHFDLIVEAEICGEDTLVGVVGEDFNFVGHFNFCRVFFRAQQ